MPESIKPQVFEAILNSSEHPCSGVFLPGPWKEAGQEVEQFAPHLAATKRINEKYGLALKQTHLVPDGYLDTCHNTVLVTTSEELQDPVTEALTEAYAREGTRFVFVGPLLLPHLPRAAPAMEDPIVQRMQQAHAAGKRIVLVSMGTVITRGDKVAGWDADLNGQSITGRDLCRAVWSGTFEACSSADFLIVVSLGIQPDPLGNIEVPSNAVCVTSFAQVDLLRAGVDVFVTHGGQNSFTEALAFATPVLVCPGFGDQVVNAAKAVTLGVGLKVDRPSIAHGKYENKAEAAEGYREDVCRCLREVLQNLTYRAAAQEQALRLRTCGGVPRAVDVIFEATKTEKTEKTEHENHEEPGLPAAAAAGA